MPPRSFYISPRVADYTAYARAFFEEYLPDVEEFARERGLPFVEKSYHLAGYLGVSSALIRQILHKPAYHYSCFTITKKDGSDREIQNPKTYLKVIQWWILDNILSRVELSESVHGFRRGHSFISNARAHSGARHILNVDIKDFFSSITDEQVMQIFLSLGYPHDGAELLARLTTLRGVTPTGAPTSPSIGNILLRDMDVEIKRFAATNAQTYTRYADDITVSAYNWIDEKTLKFLATVVEANGFTLNNLKTRFMGPGQRLEVTGLVINDRPRPSRKWRNSMRGFLHRVRMSPAEHKARFAEICGVYGLLKTVDPEEIESITKLCREVKDLLQAQ